MATLLAYGSDALQQAVELLKQGELVAFPTETVYGLGADASNPKAIQKIFAVKSRPKQQALSLLIAGVADLPYWAQYVSPDAVRLAERFWPGPLTLIVPAAPHVAPEITAGTGNIGLRIPSHPITQALLKELGRAIVAPSANLTGRLSPTQASHVDQQLGVHIPLILEGGACPLGWESTLVDLTADIPIIRREGVIIQSQIHAICPSIKVQSPSNIRRHCAEDLRLMSYSELVAQVTAPCNASRRIAVLAHRMPEIVLGAHIVWITMSENVIEYQRDFYAQLYYLEQQEYSSIWIETPPQEVAWSSVCAKLEQMRHG